MRNAKKSPASARRNGRKPAPKRKPPARAGKPVGRPKQSKAATAPCYSEQELTAVELALPAEWPVEHYAYGPCEPNYAPTIFSYDRHGRLLTVQEPGGMGGATSLQYVRNGRPKRRPPAQAGLCPQSRETRRVPFLARKEAPPAEVAAVAVRWSSGFSRLASEDAG